MRACNTCDFLKDLKCTKREFKMTSTKAQAKRLCALYKRGKGSVIDRAPVTVPAIPAGYATCEYCLGIFQIENLPAHKDTCPKKDKKDKEEKGDTK